MYISISVIFFLISLEFLKVSIRIYYNKLPTRMFYFNKINENLSSDTLRLIKIYSLVNFFINLASAYLILTSPLLLAFTISIHIVITSKIQQLIKKYS